MPSVVVVGAGPTGLALAGELAQAGVRCRVLERRDTESNLTRAFGVHARTLEMLDMRIAPPKSRAASSLADRLIPQGVQVPEVRPQMGRRPLRLSLRHPDSRFPYVLIVPQARTEALLAERAAWLGAEIVQGAEVVGLRQDDTGVDVVVDGSGGGRTERADFVVGCDGAHSAVRSLLGVEFVGSSYDTHIMLADVRLSEDLPTAVGAYLDRTGIVLLPPFGDGWYRAVIWDRERENVPLDEPLGIAEIRQSLRRIAGTDLGLREMRWSTRFLSERRQADRYRVGRVFLAGDAAHVHSPLGALGMNTGIQDAMNLGWKLGAAMHGWAPSWLLNSYEAERHPVGRAALRITDLLQRVTLAPAPVRAVRPTLARLALSLPPVRRAVRRRVSGLSIAYPPPGRRAEHPWVGKRVPDLSLGDRRLYEGLRHGRFTVLDRTSTGRFADEAANGWADRAMTIRAPHAAAPGWPVALPSQCCCDLSDALVLCGRPRSASPSLLRCSPSPLS
jgi:2-polyprenyl-6-methoxyphenol hydroxylase-like FAD-dependent oxidoreductase